MLFCRTDILEELGLAVPETWEDIYAALTVLNRNHLQLGLPNLSDNNLDVFYMLLYQYGGSVYSEAGDKTALASEESIRAFTDWARTVYQI